MDFERRFVEVEQAPRKERVVVEEDGLLLVGVLEFCFSEEDVRGAAGGECVRRFVEDGGRLAIARRS